MQGASRKTEWNVKIWKDEMAMGVFIQHEGCLYGLGGEGFRELELREFDNG